MLYNHSYKCDDQSQKIEWNGLEIGTEANSIVRAVFKQGCLKDIHNDRAFSKPNASFRILMMIH